MNYNYLTTAGDTEYH